MSKHGFFVETRADGFPWTKEGCNDREAGEWVPYATFELAQAAITARRTGAGGRWDDPTWARADYRVISALTGKPRTLSFNGGTMTPGTRIRILNTHGFPAFRGDVGVIETFVPLNKAYVQLEANGRQIVDLGDVEVKPFTGSR
jgi:hypothetical protein